MEPEGSLPHSEDPASCLYRGPARCSPHIHIPFLKIHVNIILPSTPGSSKWAVPQVSPPKLCIHLSSPPYVLHVPPISFLSPEKYWVSSTDHWAPHYVVFSTPLSPRTYWAQIFSSTSYSQATWPCVPSSMLATKFHTHRKQQAQCLNQRGGALRYKLEGRRFDSRCCNWKFSLT